MLGYMNAEALEKHQREGYLLRFSAARNHGFGRKGKPQEIFCRVIEILADCDNDTLLIKAHPQGPTCHTGQTRAFDEQNIVRVILHEWKRMVLLTARANPSPDSYTSKLLARGMNKVAQKCRGRSR